MSMVMFAMICDQCGKRSEEYGYHYHCTECPDGDDVCKDCAWPGTVDEETGKCVCTKCHKLDLAMDAVEDRAMDLQECPKCEGTGYICVPCDIAWKYCDCPSFSKGTCWPCRGNGKVPK